MSFSLGRAVLPCGSTPSACAPGTPDRPGHAEERDSYLWPTADLARWQTNQLPDVDFEPAAHACRNPMAGESEARGSNNTMHSFAGRARNTIALSGVLTGATLLAACGQTPAAAPAAPRTVSAPAVAVSAEAAHRGDIQQTLAYSGEIRARQQISILPKASGRVEQLL